VFVKLLERIVPSKPFKEKPHLTDLDIRMLDTPLVAIEQSHKELIKMGDGCRKMMDWLKTMIEAQDPDPALADRMKRREQLMDTIQDEVAHFITSLLSGNVPHAVAEEASQQLRIAHEYEAISDYLLDLLKFDQKLRQDGFRFTAKELADMSSLHDAIADYLQRVHIAHSQQDKDILAKLDTKKKHLRQNLKKQRQAHLEDLSTEAIPPQVSIAFMGVLNAYARVRDHSQNISEAIAGQV
jgi:phosphate:Na+ symporter